MNEIKAYNDIVAKYILGREETKDILLSFVNAVFDDSDYEQIKEIEILNPFNIQEYQTDKLSVLDLKAKDGKGRSINIEIQIRGDRNFAHRSLYYWSKLYSNQLKNADKFETLKPVICINLVNFVLEENYPKAHNCYLLTNKDNPALVLTDHLMIHFLELPKVTEFPGVTKLERWMNYFKSEGSEEDIMNTVIKDEPMLKKAHNEYTKFTADDKLRLMAISREMAELDRANSLYEAERKGKEEGIIDSVKNMLKEDIDTRMIARISGLSIEKIEKIKGDV
jgi:predicted transposase/invertase (TIGR01784 family)